MKQQRRGEHDANRSCGSARICGGDPRDVQQPPRYEYPGSDRVELPEPADAWQRDPSEAFVHDEQGSACQQQPETLRHGVGEWDCSRADYNRDAGERQREVTEPVGELKLDRVRVSRERAYRT